MADRHSWTWEKIVDNETGASLETGQWARGPRWMPTFGYRPFAEAGPIALDAKPIRTSAKYFEEGGSVRGFLLVKTIIEWELNNAPNKSLSPRTGDYTYSYIVSLMSKFLTLTRPREPKYQMTDLVCETDAEYYNKIGEELTATIDELLKDGRFRIIWSEKWMR